MFCITFFIFFGSYKFISFDIFLRLCSIFLISNSLTIFINVFCNYIWSWFYFLVDMFCITFFIFFSFYKFISFDIFLRLCSIFLKCWVFYRSFCSLVIEALFVNCTSCISHLACTTSNIAVYFFLFDNFTVFI